MKAITASLCLIRDFSFSRGDAHSGVLCIYAKHSQHFSPLPSKMSSMLSAAFPMSSKTSPTSPETSSKTSPRSPETSSKPPPRSPESLESPKTSPESLELLPSSEPGEDQN